MSLLKAACSSCSPRALGGWLKQLLPQHEVLGSGYQLIHRGKYPPNVGSRWAKKPHAKQNRLSLATCGQFAPLVLVAVDPPAKSLTFGGVSGQCLDFPKS